jgi:hypothetical protein
LETELLESYKPIKKHEMAKFRVRAKVTTYCYLDIEADYIDDAIDIGRETDGGDFITEDKEGEFEVIEAKEIKDGEE